MSWWEANAARRRNIGSTVSSISQQAQSIAQLAEEKKRRQQQAFQNVAAQLQEIAQRKFQKEEREASQKYATGERLGGQGYGTREREAMQKYATGEREAGQEFKKAFQFPHEVGKARAGRAEQNIYAGGDEKLAMFEKGFNSWLDKAGSQNPDWFTKNEYGEPTGYNIPDEGWAQFVEYMSTMYGTDPADTQAYINSIRASMTEQPQPVLEDVTTKMGGYVQPEMAPEMKVNEILRDIRGLSTEGMDRGSMELFNQFQKYAEGGWAPEERDWVFEAYPQLRQMIDTYKIPAATKAREGARTPGRGR